MLAIPEINEPSVVFGNIDHMPHYADLPPEFQDWHRQAPHCRAISTWFYKGAEFKDGRLIIGAETFAPKPGVDGKKALRAIRAVMASWAPKHEHKIGACGFMLSQWFDVVAP